MYVIRNQLPAPTCCDNCEGPNVKLTSNEVIYGKNHGDWPYCYYCIDCDAMVGCHPNTHNPMGLMATGATRRQRMRLHFLFDPIWKRNYLSRDDAYKWLANQLNITEECHIGYLTKDQLKTAIVLLTAHNINGYEQFRRRRNKNATRRLAKQLRDDNKINIRKAKYQPR